MKDIETELTEAKALQDDPVKKELEKIQKPKLTKKERLLFAKKKIDEQLKGEDGFDPDEPLTIGKYRELQTEESIQQALLKAENIEEESEKELTKHYLQNRIKPSGDADDDLRIARAAVNSLRNAQIAEEINRKVQAKTYGSPSGAPGKREEIFEATADELVFMGPPYNLSKEDIIKQRQRSQE